MKDPTIAEVETALVPTDDFDEPTGVAELARQIKLAVRRSTSARVHNLSVKVTGTDVVLHGFCSTFHCFQLAQHAAMRLADDLSIDNQIEVL